jgi:type VI secretion system secreted protein Hcp
MPISPLIVFYDINGKNISGPVRFYDPELNTLMGSVCVEFDHCVSTAPQDYIHSLLCGNSFVRKHEPMTLVKKIDKTSTTLMHYFRKGKFFQKVEIRWYQYNSKTNKNEEYFRMIVEYARLMSVRHTLLNVKDHNLENYDHLERIQLVYNKITWLYLDGHISHTDTWENSFSEEDGYATSVEELKEPIEHENLNLEFYSGKFLEPTFGFTFDKKVSVEFKYKTNRKLESNENKVYAKLYSVHNNVVEDMHVITEGRLIKDNVWVTEFTLKKPSGTLPVEYYAEVESNFANTKVFKSESINVPSKPKGFICVLCKFYDNDDIITNAEYTLNKEDGSFVCSGLTDDNGKIDIEDIVLDNYVLSINCNGDYYDSKVWWQKNSTVQELRFKRNIFAIDETIIGGENATLSIVSLQYNTKITSEKCVIEFFNCDTSELLAGFVSSIKRQDDSFYFDTRDIKRTDPFYRELPEPETQDSNGSIYLVSLKTTPPFFYLSFDTDRDNSEKYLIRLNDNNESPIYRLRYSIKVNDIEIYNSDKLTIVVNCFNIIGKNCSAVVDFIAQNHIQNRNKRLCGTHYGALYPYRFNNEEEYIKAAQESGFSTAAEKFKGKWDQGVKNTFEKNKREYNLKMTDCINFVINVMELGFNKSLLSNQWHKCRRHLISNTGQELAAGLVDLGWVALYYTPDTVNFKDMDVKKIHKRSYVEAIEHQQYGNSYNKPIVPIHDVVVNYRPTIKFFDQTDVAKPIVAETNKLERVMKLPFAFILGEYGTHTGLLLNGNVAAVHWTESCYSDLLFDTDLTQFSSSIKQRTWMWLSGIIVTPRFFWENEV